jgi:ATP-dependent DNA ligase
MRVNQGQELVIGGYTPSDKNFDALVIGYYDGPKLMYAARTRNGFTPASRAKLFEKLKPLETANCPFANLPAKTAGRWGAGLTAKKMAECRWLKPSLVGQFEPPRSDSSYLPLSRRTAVAFLSSRRATNRVCRRWFSPVHSTNSHLGAPFIFAFHRLN